MPRKSVMILIIILAILFIAQSLTAQWVNAKASIRQPKGVGIAIYTDALGLNVCSNIDWNQNHDDNLKPGDVIPSIIYVKNVGSTPVTLTLTTNFSPSIAETYLAITWNYNNAMLQPNDIIPVTLTLTISPSTTNITNFTCDITITPKR